MSETQAEDRREAADPSSRGVSMVQGTRNAGMRSHTTCLQEACWAGLSERSAKQLTLMRTELVQRLEVRGDTRAAQHAPHIRRPRAVGGDDHAAILGHREAPVRGGDEAVKRTSQSSLECCEVRLGQCLQRRQLAATSLAHQQPWRHDCRRPSGQR